MYLLLSQRYVFRNSSLELTDQSLDDTKSMHPLVSTEDVKQSGAVLRHLVRAARTNEPDGVVGELAVRTGSLDPFEHGVHDLGAVTFPQGGVRRSLADGRDVSSIRRGVGEGGLVQLGGHAPEEVRMVADQGVASVEASNSTVQNLEDVLCFAALVDQRRNRL